MDVDENYVTSESDDRHPLKTAESPEPTTELKAHLSNGNCVDGMEVEDPDNEKQAEHEEAESTESAPALRPHDPPPALDCTSTLNGVPDGLSFESPELSPTLRRSTRTACLKAQEKLRLKEGMVDSHALENGPTSTTVSTVSELPIETTAADAEIMEVPQKKKRKLSANIELDQYDCKFGIRLDDDGDVVMMTDESEISSLTEEDTAAIRQKFEETRAQLSELTPEAQREREYQVRELETALREEEAKLAMLKKTRANQQVVARNAGRDTAHRLPSGISQHPPGSAYKPAVAGQNPAPRLNGTANAAAIAAVVKSSHNQRGRSGKSGITPAGPLQMTPAQQQFLQRLMESGSLRPEHLVAIIQAMNPAALSALNPAARQQAQQREQQQQREAQERERRQRVEQEAAAQRKAVEAQAAADRLARENAQSAQQKIANARVQFRKIAEQRMLAALPQPKAPVSDLSFIPNAAQPDFLYLLGLDLVVQRNLKDKNVFKKVEFDPYVCEECGTDFTPNWKAIAGEKGDLHLYCEQCLRQAQKRRVRHDRNVLLKKLFTKISEEEKEFERQIQSGKLAESLAASSAASSSSYKIEPKVESKTESTPSKSLTSGLPPNFNAATLSNLMNSVKNLPHSASSLLNPATTSNSGSSANRNSAAIASLAVASRAAPKPDLKKPAPATPSRNKRGQGTSSSGSASNSVNTQLAALANNPQALTSLMTQLQAVQALRNINPTAFGNANTHPLLQLYQQQQRMNNAASAGTNNANIMGQLMNQIAQNHATSTTTSTSHSSSNQQSSAGSGGSSNSAANLLAAQMSSVFRQMVGAGGNSSAAQNFLQNLTAAANRKK